jgi:hypothetical protein
MNKSKVDKYYCLNELDQELQKDVLVKGEKHKFNFFKRKNDLIDRRFTPTS